MRKATYEMFHDRFAREMERRVEVLLAVGVGILALYAIIYRVF